jgi:hypothetical protein
MKCMMLPLTGCMQTCHDQPVSGFDTCKCQPQNESAQMYQEADGALLSSNGVAVPVPPRPVVAVQVQRRIRRLAVQRQHQPCSAAGVSMSEWRWLIKACKVYISWCTCHRHVGTLHVHVHSPIHPVDGLPSGATYVWYRFFQGAKGMPCHVSWFAICGYAAAASATVYGLNHQEDPAAMLSSGHTTICANLYMSVSDTQCF